MHYAMLIVLFPDLVLAREVPTPPNGHALFDLPSGEFQAHVSGICLLVAGT